MTRAEKIEAAAKALLEARVVSVAGIHMNSGSRCLCGCDPEVEALRSALSSPASPGTEPRAMEEIERLLDRALSIGLKDAKVSGWREDVLSAIRRALGSAPAEPLLTWDDLRNHTHSQVADLLVENPGHSVIAAEAASRLRSLGSAPGAASPGERGPSLPPQTYEDGFRECRVAAECCVEAEEELSGPMPEAMLSALRERPEDVLRATVRTTKDGILARVQALRPMLAPPPRLPSRARTMQRGGSRR